MKLLKVKDGHTFLSSISELRKEFPHVSFPSDLAGVNLSQYGYMLSDDPDSWKVRERLEVVPTRVAMHQFLYALRDFGVRVQFEAYALSLEGHARDYWFTAPYVNKDHVCVKHMAEFFQLSKADLRTIFSIAGSIEE